MAAAANHKPYVCQLDAQSAEKAKKELNEDPKDRMNAVNALQTWIQQQPHITFNPGQCQFILCTDVKPSITGYISTIDQKLIVKSESNNGLLCAIRYVESAVLSAYGQVQSTSS